MWRQIWPWILMIAAAFFLMETFYGQASVPEVSYSQFIEDVKNGMVSEVRFEGDGITVTGTRSSDGSRFSTVRPVNVYDGELVSDLYENNVTMVGAVPERPGLLQQLFVATFPLLVLAGLFLFFMRQASGGGLGSKGGPLSFGENKAKLLQGGKVNTTFADVAGCEEAKEEVQELVQFLRDPERFKKLGGRIPRGVLLVGPPGTGKTLIARAIAGEAGVNFFTISGSDFVEMFVGVGAARVRKMFSSARQQAPCIIFIDEIDAVGRHRGAGLGGGHDEREQTLNQLLVEMDGFEAASNIIVMAATNRPDVLDPALLRPGRFDRQVVVDLPDIAGREKILKVHTRKVPLAKDVDLHTLARGTPGFSGADLANLINEAALLAARRSLSMVTNQLLQESRDKVMMGTERRSLVMSEDERKLTAYHESGHVIVGLLAGDHDPVHKVSIIPRGRALGVTVFLPEEDRHSHSRKSILARISSLYGGRLAEELIFGEESVTTGASNDIQNATDLARSMVTKWGLSDKLGPVRYEEDGADPFLGRRATQDSRSLSTNTAEAIEQEVRTIIDDCYAKAKKLLEANMDKLHTMSEALLKYETLEREQIDDIMAGAEPREPPAPPEADDPGPDPEPSSEPKAASS